MITNRRSHSLTKIVAPMLCAVALLVGCEKSEEQATTATGYFSMDIPDSMTGGKSTLVSNAVASKASSVLAATSSSDVPCIYLGADSEDPFRNGYEMTKFMVSVVAVWTCVADNAITLSNSIEHDGLMIATGNDQLASDYDAEEPTHYRIIDLSDSQSSLFLYYGYTADVPPTNNDLAGIYLSWNETEAGDVQGKFIIDIAGMTPENVDPEAPSAMRIDFDNTSDQKLTNMYLMFDNGNQWADGFRIEVAKDLTVAADQQVFTARGLLSMKGQFLPANGVTESPTMKMFTVSDAFGEGAAVSEFLDIALPLELNAETGNHLGNYIFSKEDKYFFDANQRSSKPWDWIEKIVTSAEYRGGRTTPTTGGTFEPFDPSLDLLNLALGLDASYFTGTQCGDLNSDCTDFMNAVIEDGFAGQEMNQGSEPADWRAAAIQSGTYLDSVLPLGDSWDTVFLQNFSPTL